MSSLRKDRFFCAIPFVNQDKFNKSGFLQLYNKTDKHPDKTTVINLLYDLPGGFNKYNKVIEDIIQTSDEYDMIRTYTSDIEADSRAFYTYINQELCDDNKETLPYLMPFIRRATYQINRHPPPFYCITYRGMWLNSNQREYFQVGAIFRFPGFTSTSESKSLAKRHGDTLFEIHIYSGCLQVRNVSDISHFPEEQEYLFSPYSLFEVTKKEHGMITLRALDNMAPVAMNIPKPAPIHESVAYPTIDVHPKPSNIHTPNNPWTESDTALLSKPNKAPSHHLNHTSEENNTAYNCNYGSIYQPTYAEYSTTVMDPSCMEYTINKWNGASNYHPSASASERTITTSCIPDSFGWSEKQESSSYENHYASIDQSSTSASRRRSDDYRFDGFSLEGSQISIFTENEYVPDKQSSLASLSSEGTGCSSEHLGRPSRNRHVSSWDESMLNDQLTASISPAKQRIFSAHCSNQPSNEKPRAFPNKNPTKHQSGNSAPLRKINSKLLNNSDCMSREMANKNRPMSSSYGQVKKVFKK